MRIGIELVEWFKNETKRTYAILGESDDDHERRKLVEWIAGKGGAVTARELQQGRRDIKTATGR